MRNIMNLTRLWQYIQRIINVYCVSLPGNYRRKKIIHLEQIYQVTNQYLKTLNVGYWLDFGTLLGYYRERNILLHDVDVDFGISEVDFEKTWTSRHLLPKGFTMYDTSHKHRGPKLFISYKGFDVDLYFYEDQGKKIASYEESKYPSDSKPLDKHLVFPIKEIEFLGSSTFIPNAPKEYLEHYYGYIGANRIRDQSTGYWMEI
ncbi:MAG: phosphorylcholine metabolism protein LicD [Cyclobacteriaceae bacterium]|jgi:phosphorylcholine metabolism protein LicD